MNFKKIMVGVDDSPDALKAFRYAIQEARQAMAELIIVSILEEKNINVYQSLDKNYWEKEMNELRERSPLGSFVLPQSSMKAIRGK